MQYNLDLNPSAAVEGKRGGEEKKGGWCLERKVTLPTKSSERGRRENSKGIKSETDGGLYFGKVWAFKGQESSH